jgi:hypothetical protein
LIPDAALLPQLQPMVIGMGVVQSVNFKGVGPGGADNLLDGSIKDRKIIIDQVIVDRARLQLSYAQVTAPITGRGWSAPSRSR